MNHKSQILRGKRRGAYGKILRRNDYVEEISDMVKLVYQITKNKDFCRDFSLTDQIRRAAVSVMSNIAEGFERGSNTEFIQFLFIAKRTCGEVRTHHYAASDQT